MVPSKLKVGIIDYGTGNHTSVKTAYESLGYKAIVSSLPDQLRVCDLLVLPGVGSFPVAMSNLQSWGLAEHIKEAAILGTPIIGICLGMQLLTTESYEDGHTSGLNLIGGSVLPFNDKAFHIGWNKVSMKETGHTSNINSESIMYFNHSLICNVAEEYSLGTTEFDHEFTAIIARENIVGVQFHPEKSQNCGLLFLKNLTENLLHD